MSPDGYTIADPDPATIAKVTAAEARRDRPDLLIVSHDPDLSAFAVRDTLRDTGVIFERGVLVRLAHDQQSGGMVAHAMTPEAVIRTLHQYARPIRRQARKDGAIDEVPMALPRTLAASYLDMRGEWQVPVLNGIASSPLLHADGSIHTRDGYDAETGLWCENVPEMTNVVPARPDVTQAKAALLLLRKAFRTFPFADAGKVLDRQLNVPVVDLGKQPGKDESGFLAGLLTAVCRPSLHTAPGFLIHAPAMSGAGTGKGLLARAIATVAFGRAPHAVTQGGTPEELEKRISAELIEGAPILFLDNFNGVSLKSDTLASAITERPARTRLLGKSSMVPLNATAFITLTGNGLTVSEDLARRIISAELDAGMEDPEARPFKGDFLTTLQSRRAELLAACLTIWRWGRQNANTLKRGKALGSFGQWGEWVRDPLLALGCHDPAERVSEAKAKDERRQKIAELFALWAEHHNYPTKAADLHSDLKLIIDPQGRGRQFLSSALQKLVGTRVAGFILTEQKPAGKWGSTTYQVARAQDAWQG
jgi:hypothetical protein